MSKKKYTDLRQGIPADKARIVKVEAGHKCGIRGCNEHTYVEIHHINENGEDNRVENLILLCDKHHKMAHKGVIDRKSLHEYKKLLNIPDIITLNERFQKLESLISTAEPFLSTMITSKNAIKLILEEAILLGDSLRNTPEGIKLTQEMFFLIRKNGNLLGLESVNLMVR